MHFCGESSPTFGNDVFAGISTNSVMTTETYEDNKFSTLKVVKGSTIDECLPQTSTSMSNTLIIVTVCVSVAAIVVATLLITLLVKIRIGKQDTLSMQMAEDFEINDSAKLKKIRLQMISKKTNLLIKYTDSLLEVGMKHEILFIYDYFIKFWIFLKFKKFC